ncbi:MAG: hypothetical protein O2856_09360, partial [Planctomycetota bacterium]|nr:hypothetical protein [Planctomycetota bacterium]
MAGISIACSSCGAFLKLPDASMIGKRVKCPKCGNRFILTMPQLATSEPEEVPLQLVDPTVPTAAPVMGTSARWVPDAPVPVIPQATAVQPTAVPDGFGVSTPQSHFGIASQAEAAAPFAIPGIDTNSAAATGSVLNRVQGRRRKTINKSTLAGLAVVVIGSVVGSIVFMKQGGTPAPQPKIQPSPVYQETVAKREASNDDAKALSPTSGAKIPIDYLPFTPQVLCHMHPAELWKEDRNTAELQAMLSTLGLWLKDQITSRTRFEPEEISELTFAINFGARMSAPDVAAVVRLKSPQTDQEFMKRFRGRIYADPKVEMYEAEDFSYMKIDDQTFALAPSNMSESLAMAMKDPALLSSDMEPLVAQSDRDRHLTLMFDVKILDSHREDVFITQLQTLADKFLFWFGEDVQTVSWSMHLEPNLYMETLLHQTQASTPVKLQRFAQVKL